MPVLPIVARFRACIQNSLRSGSNNPYRALCQTPRPGHYETWDQRRLDWTVDPALCALVRSSEYEDWPRGRIVFDRARDLFIIYADRKLLTPATIARIKRQFHLPAERTEVKSDWHYQSTETPNGLVV
jgi:hypothetical protein